MAKVLVSFELIAQTLFPNRGIRINGVEVWDHLTAAVEIEGLGVPDCDWVEVTVTKEMMAFEFNEMKEQVRFSAEEPE